MRRFLTCLLALCALALGAQSPTASVDVAKAQAEYDRLKALVDAGALPRKALDDAEDTLAEARDQGVLHQLLYGRLSLDELTEQQSREMVDASVRRVERKQRRLEAAKKRVELGVAPITSLTPVLEELDASRRVHELALSRARLFEELVSIVHAEELAIEQSEDAAPSGPQPALERFQGIGAFSTAQWKSVLLAYEQEFRKPLPVSAQGETALHRSLGFDHRGRIDVAVAPDSREGLWLRKYLEAIGISYLAFRHAVPGQATAAHIHVGPPSQRIRRAD